MCIQIDALVEKCTLRIKISYLVNKYYNICNIHENNFFVEIMARINRLQ